MMILLIIIKKVNQEIKQIKKKKKVRVKQIKRKKIKKIDYYLMIQKQKI